MTNNHGLFNKYTVTKTNGEPTDPGAQYFVLRIDTDYAARFALTSYISAIQERQPEFAQQLIDWLESTPVRSDNPQIDAIVSKVLPYKAKRGQKE
jgi:hypothetical protein